MPITLTLTDDQALDIVSQVSQLLSKKAATTVESPLKISFETEATDDKFPKGSDVRKQVRKYLAGFDKGQTFRIHQAYSALNAETATQRVAISNRLRTFVRHGKVEMIRRGTWKVIA